MRKRNLSTRLLSILVCVCMVLCFLPAVAFAADMTGGEVLYLKPNSEWASANARFAIYVYGSGEAWESMVPVEGADGIYQVTVPSGNWTNVIFCRMNPATTDNNWNNKWNQSGDLVYDGVNNLCTIKNGQWDCGMNVTWSVYSKEACPHENHDVDGKCTACGEPVEHNYVGGSCVCGAENPDAFKVYFINSPKWDEVAAYAWINGGAGLSWPGTLMTKSGDTVNGCDVYEVIFDMAYESVIFNNNNKGSQTDDLTMVPGQYYDMNNDTWYESLEDVPVVEEPACTHENHDVDGKCTACGEPVEHKYVGGSCVCGAENPDAFKVYFINSAMWAEVSAHAWIEGVGGTTWPGEAMTRTEETVNDFDVYEIIFDVAYENVIFNNTQGIQTDNLEMMPNQYFNMEDGTWYESLDDVPAVDPLATDTFLVGSFNEWSTTANEFKRNAEGDAIAYVSLELEAETKYDFKIVRGGAWTSCDTAITGDISDLVFSGDVSGNCSITTTAADTYVFAYDLGSNTLSVVYPEVEEPACTHENHDVDGKCTSCGEPVEHSFVGGSCVCGAVNPDAITVYYINSDNWDQVFAYAWNEGGQALEWPGVIMTKTDDTVNGFDVYAVTFDVPFEQVLFTNNSGNQTTDMAMMPGQYFNQKDKVWYESLDQVPVLDPLATDVFLVGAFNEWSCVSDEFKLVAEGATTASVSMELEANTTYEFKVYRYGVWTSYPNAITGDVSGLMFSRTYENNCFMTTTEAGIYVFTFNTEDVTLSITYPVPACTHENHDVDGKCTACGEPVEHIYVDGVCACGFKNGIVAENDGLYYYVDGKLNYAGLIEIDGDMYYVRCNGELVRGKTYWTTKTNGLKDYAGYYFDEDGKLHERNGLIEENGGLYYYVNSKLYYAGLIEIDGNLYYIRSNGQAVTGRTYWTTKTNGLKEYAGYYFDETGKLCE